VLKALDEDLGTIFSLSMFSYSYAIFVMLSLCYVQCLDYLLHSLFPSPNILQHYTKFDIHTIVTLEKLFDAKYFDGFINHLVCH
jgi:hypothetical protein